MSVTFERSDEKRGRRYVWRVLIDGQLRATIAPSTFSPSYYLRDKAGTPIRLPRKPDERKAREISAASLEGIKRHAMAAAAMNLIPTDADIEARRAAALQKEAEYEAQQAEIAARERKERAGPQLLAALEALHLNPNRPPKGWNLRSWREAVAQAVDAMRAATGDDKTS